MWSELVLEIRASFDSKHVVRWNLPVLREVRQQGVDLGVDQVELGLHGVQPEVAHFGGRLVNNQVFRVLAKSKTIQFI